MQQHDVGRQHRRLAQPCYSSLKVAAQDWQYAESHKAAGLAVARKLVASLLPLDENP